MLVLLRLLRTRSQVAPFSWDPGARTTHPCSPHSLQPCDVWLLRNKGPSASVTSVVRQPCDLGTVSIHSSHKRPLGSSSVSGPRDQYQ